MHELYEHLTRERRLRADELVYAAAEYVPELPTHEQVQAERELLQKDKQGLEVAQGAFLGDVLADPESGPHLIDTMLRPTQLALDHLAELRDTGRVDLGRAAVERRGKVGIVELCNLRHLNAEDDTTIGPFEAAIDLVLLDDQIEIGVLRGGVVEHERYAGRRIFGAGLNLTHLYRGKTERLVGADRDGLGLRAENCVHGYAGTALRRCSMRSFAFFTADEASAE
jgi:thioesterase DpgC